MTRLSEEALNRIEMRIKHCIEHGFRIRFMDEEAKSLISEIREHRLSRSAGEADAEAGSPTGAPTEQDDTGVRV